MKLTLIRKHCSTRKFKIIPILIISFIGLLFFFKNLDNWYLWSDEAQYAMLSKCILKHGVPIVYDGKNIIVHDPEDYCKESRKHILYGWLPLYVNAFFFLFKLSTFSARFSSSLIGILFVLGVYTSLKRWNLARGIPMYSALVILFCIPLILFFRQCHYYGWSILFFFGMFISFIKDPDRKENQISYLVCSIGLLNTNLLAWGIAGLSLIASSAFVPSKRKAQWKLLIINGVLALPFFFLYKIWNMWVILSGVSVPKVRYSYIDKLAFYIQTIGISITPFWFLLAILISTVFLWKRFNFDERFLLKNLIFVFLFSVLLIPFCLQYIFVRYIIFIVPLVLIIQSIVIMKWFEVRKWVGIGFILISFFIHFLNIRLDQEKNYYSFLRPFWYELTHDSEDLNEVLASFLNANAKDDEVVVCPYGDFPLMFYTSLVIRGGPGRNGVYGTKRDEAFGITPLVKPDWIVFREKWFHLYPKGFFESFLDKYEYEEIILNVEETSWGNRPSPFHHFFCTPLISEPLKIYHLKQKS